MGRHKPRYNSTPQTSDDDKDAVSQTSKGSEGGNEKITGDVPEEVNVDAPGASVITPGRVPRKGDTRNSGNLDPGDHNDEPPIPPLGPNLFNLFMKLMGWNLHDEDLRRLLRHVFAHWGVTTWEDLSSLTHHDVATLVLREDVPRDLKTAVAASRLAYLVHYAHLGTINELTTFQRVVDAVRREIGHEISISEQPIPKKAPATTDLVLTPDASSQMKIPKLPTFSGKDEDYFVWRGDVLNTLGRFSLDQHVSDKAYVDQHKSVARGVFFALKQALDGGTAKPSVEALFNRGKFCPATLAANMDKTYDTHLNRANVNLYQIKRLFGLRLDLDTEPSTFISSFRDSLEQLSKARAQLPKDEETLRALLLIAIQDDDFESVRDKIVENPKLGYDKILIHIRERHQSLAIKDDAGITGDGARVRRTPHKTGTGSQGSTGQFKIPRLPSSWRRAFGPKLFDVIISWRGAAHSGKYSQASLDKKFDLEVQEMGGRKRPNRSTRRGRGGRTNHAARRSNDGMDVDEGEQDNSSVAGTEGSNDAGSTGQGDRPKKRICYRETKRVVTERF